MQEDWFEDGDAYHWSFLTAKLRSAAQDSPHAKSINFAGYTVPRKSGYLEGGLQQKMLAQVGGGAKALRNFVFGVRTHHELIITDVCILYAFGCVVEQPS